MSLLVLQITANTANHTLYFTDTLLYHTHAKIKPCGIWTNESVSRE